MSRLNNERQKKLEPLRISAARKEIEALGLSIVSENNTRLQFVFKGETITFFPYSGWASGKTIKDGRGLKNLISQLKNS